jgi:hypothetical protein
VKLPTPYVLISHAKRLEGLCVLHRDEAAPKKRGVLAHEVELAA